MPLSDPSTIRPDQLDAALARYPALISAVSQGKSKSKTEPQGGSLVELDRWRLEDLPKVLEKRQSTGDRSSAITGDKSSANLEVGKGGVFLTLDELERLVKWKLKHGKFRPTLLGLVRSNSDATVKETTRRAFEQIFVYADGDEVKSASEARPSPDQQRVLAALDVLVAGLRGVGPATASLVLSCACPHGVPFFSDELAAWLLHPSSSASAVKLKYNRQEYAQLLQRTADLLARVQRQGWRGGASELERAAYVLVRDGDGVGQDESDAPAPTTAKRSGEATRESDARKAGPAGKEDDSPEESELAGANGIHGGDAKDGDVSKSRDSKRRRLATKRAGEKSKGEEAHATSNGAEPDVKASESLRRSSRRGLHDSQ